MFKKLAHSFAWDFLGKISNQLITLVIGIILARLLSPKEYGLIGMSMVFISFSEIFTNLGLSTALIQKQNPTEEHFSSSFYLNVVAAIILVSLFIFIAPFIATFYKSPEIVSIIRVLSFGMLISSFSIVQEAKLRKEINFKQLSLGKFVSAVVGGIVGIIMAYKGYGVWSLVTQTLISRTMTGIYYWFKSTWVPKFIFKINAIKDLWSYSMNMFLSGFLNTLYDQLDSLLIGRLFSITDLGLYTRAKSLNRFVIRFSSESVGNITFPAMAGLNNDKPKLVELGMKAESLIAFVSWGLLGFLYVTAEPLFLMLFGQKWIAAIPIYKILCLSGFAYPISAATLSMLKASGDSRTFLKLEIYKKIIGLVCTIGGLFIGLHAFLISLIISGFIGTILNMYLTAKSINIKFKEQFIESFLYFIPACISAMLALFASSFFSNMYVTFLISTIIFGVMYIFINIIFKTKGLKLVLQKLPIFK